MGSSKRRAVDYEHKYVKCLICTKDNLNGSYKDWEEHMHFSHSRLLIQIGNVFWIDQHEAFYKGKHYKPKNK